MKAKGKKKSDQKMIIRVGALVLAALMVLGVVFTTVGTQSSHSHTYTAEELAALQAVYDATGEDHSGHEHSVEELEQMLNDATAAGGAEGETAEDEAAEEDHTGHDHE